MISKEARVEALSRVGSPADHPHEILDWYEKSLSDPWRKPYRQEADGVLERTKPERYAYFATAIDALLDVALEQRTTEAPYGLPTGQGCLNGRATFPEPWRSWEANFSLAISRHIGSIDQTDAFQNARKANMAVSWLMPDRYIRVEDQLDFGTQTAATSMFSVLSCLPDFIRYYDPSCPPSRWADVARRSLQIPNKLASISLNSLDAAHGALELGAGEHKLNPDKITPVFRDGSIAAFTLKHVDDLPLGPDVRIELLYRRTEYDLVKDVPDEDVPVIGCPITLLRGRLGQLWDWAIDIVDGEGLWTQPGTDGRQALPDYHRFAGRIE